MTQPSYLSELNPPQQEAVQHIKGPLLIIAGAGAGKTKTVTHRILHLIKSGVAPGNILAITFTNKAAKEMSERVQKLIKKEASLQFPISNDQSPTMCTFHSLGVRILRESGSYIDVPKHFSIYDESDAVSVIKDALKTLDLDPKQFEPKRIKNTISRSKGDLIDQKRYAQDAGNDYFPRVVAQVWEQYEKQLKAEKGLDFDDLLLKTVQLLRENAEVRGKYQKRFQYIHVDEYQDTNVAQYELSKLLTDENQNICVVGDMDQCLPPQTKIATPNGEKEIQHIKEGDLVYSAAGHGGVCTQKVEKVHKRTFNRDMVKIHTKKGAILACTPGHVLFAGTLTQQEELGLPDDDSRSASVIEGEELLFQPAANLLPTMCIAYLKNGTLVDDIVTRVDKKPYTGSVYDLDIENTHNYIAGNIPVHNSIYSWRGADFRNILNFEHDFPNAKTVLLEENYRSTKTILSAANEIIKKNETRKEKNLFTNKEDGERIGLFGAYDESEEAEFIATRSKQLIENGAEPKDIAVLYRANFQSRVLEDAFLRAEIPYQVLGVKFFARKEIKDVLSFIRAGLNPESAADIKRVINAPARGIGKVTVAKIFAGEREKMTGAMKQKVDDFFALLSTIGQIASTEKPSATIVAVIKKSGLHDAYRKGSEEEVERLENMYELAALAERYDDLSPEEGIEKLLEDAALASDQDSMDTQRQKEDKNAVRLMTVHAAKGLEFPYVFISGLEQGLFPHEGFADSTAAQERAEEERRLFYVAITRAEKKAFLSYASTRMKFGMKDICMPSEFIIDIPDEFMEEETLGDVIR